MNRLLAWFATTCALMFVVFDALAEDRPAAPPITVVPRGVVVGAHLGISPMLSEYPTATGLEGSPIVTGLRVGYKRDWMIANLGLDIFHKSSEGYSSTMDGGFLTNSSKTLVLGVAEVQFSAAQWAPTGIEVIGVLGVGLGGWIGSDSFDSDTKGTCCDKPRPRRKFLETRPDGEQSRIVSTVKTC